MYNGKTLMVRLSVRVLEDDGCNEDNVLRNCSEMFVSGCFNYSLSRKYLGN